MYVAKFDFEMSKEYVGDSRIDVFLVIQLSRKPESLGYPVVLFV